LGQLPDFATLKFSAIFAFHDSRDWVGHQEYVGHGLILLQGRDTQLITDIAMGRNGCLSQPRDSRKDEWSEQDQVRYPTV
jgi:hypothetical protein